MGLRVDAILRANPPRRISADRLGRHLHVSDFERSALRIYTIGSYQTPKAERVRQRKEKDRLHKQARRRASGARPHEQSLSRTKPWEARGVSPPQGHDGRETKPQGRETDSSAIYFLLS